MNCLVKANLLSRFRSEFGNSFQIQEIKHEEAAAFFTDGCFIMLCEQLLEEISRDSYRRLYCSFEILLNVFMHSDGIALNDCGCLV